ncbi:MAG: helix-turn-helix domain-containing protein, partial [Clostridia bacterium]|nr:helix-turn-helix domain-containing protein [Clostridia bacterium]
MAYSEEIKGKVLSEVKAGKRITEIGKKYEISPSTIYGWKRIITGTKKEDKKFTKLVEEEKEVSMKIRTLITLRKFEEAKKIGEKFPDNEPIQSQMVTIYMKEGRIKEAKKIGEKFPDYEPIQSQMVTIYMKEGRIK